MRYLSQGVEGVDDIFTVTLLLETGNDKREERERERESEKREREREREREEAEKRTRMMITSESGYHSRVLVWNVTIAKGKVRYDI